MHEQENGKHEHPGFQQLGKGKGKDSGGKGWGNGFGNQGGKGSSNGWGNGNGKGVYGLDDQYWQPDWNQGPDWSLPRSDWRPGITAAGCDAAASVPLDGCSSRTPEQSLVFFAECSAVASGRREQRHAEAAQPVITGTFCQEVAGGASSSPDPDEKQFQRAR